MDRSHIYYVRTERLSQYFDHRRTRRFMMSILLHKIGEGVKNILFYGQTDDTVAPLPSPLLGKPLENTVDVQTEFCQIAFQTNTSFLPMVIMSTIQTNTFQRGSNQCQHWSDLSLNCFSSQPYAIS